MGTTVTAEHRSGQVVRVAFDEFKLYYESTEKVTDRRLEANRWNYSLCAATLGAVGLIAGWGMSKPERFVASDIVVSLLCGIAALYCTLWMGQIRDYKELNNAKFSVLNAMAPLVVFSEKDNDQRSSFLPFEKEWKALQESMAAREVLGMKIVALKSSNIEYLLPKALRLLFGLATLAGFVLLVLRLTGLAIA